MINHKAYIEKSDYSISIVDSFDQLYCGKFDQPVIFLSVEWFQLQQKILDSDLSVIRIYTCEDSHASGMRVMFPLYTKKTRKFGLKEEGLFSLSNYYTPYYSPPGADKSPDCLLTGVVESMLKPKQFSHMVLRPIDIEDKTWIKVVSILKRRYWLSYTDFEFGNWYHVVDGSYTEYFNARPSNVKNTYNRKFRLFDRIENSRIEIVRDCDLLCQYIVDYNIVYKNSWKQEEPHELFIPELIRLAASRGELRLGLAYIGEVPIAAHLWLVSADVASIFKLSYDESYSRYSPGTLVMCEMLKYVIDTDKVCKIDFLSGDDQYKQDWMSSRREMKAIYAYNLLSIGGALRFAHHSIKIIIGWISTLIRQLVAYSESAARASSSS